MIGSNYKIIKDSSELNSNLWSDFVLKHPNGCIFQTPEMFNIYINTKNFKPFLFAVLKADEEILGLMSGVIMQNYFWPIKTLTSRAVINGAPLIKEDNKEILHLLLKEFEKEIRGKVIYAQFRNMWDWGESKIIFKSLDYSYEPHLDIHINLSEDKEFIINAISHNKKRNVTKSVNKGLQFEEINNYEVYNKALDMIYKTYARVSLPIADISLFKHAYNELFPKGMLKVFAAVFQNEIIGIRLELLYKKSIYDWYAGSDENYRNKYVNDFLPYNILIWGNKNLFELFNFGGAGNPNIAYGVRDHKLKFGGKVYEFGRFEKTFHPFLFFIGKTGFQMSKTIKNVQPFYKKAD